MYPTEQELITRHNELNRGVGSDRIVLRPGLDFAIDEGARVGFEMFCFRYLGGNVELDHFVSKMMGKRRLLDVGSLHGLFSMVFASRHGAQSLAIEPSPIGLPRLRRNCRLNPQLAIRVVDCAAGAAEGVIPMRFEWEHLVAGGTNAENSQMIRVRPIDEILSDMRYAPDMVKIDVEGYETQVLGGMRQTLEVLRPDIHLECHGDMLLELGSSPKDIFDILARYDYRPADLWTGEECVWQDQPYPNVWHMYCTPREGSWLRGVVG